MAVAPGGAVDRGQELRRAHASEVPQRILERALLGRNLCTGVLVLQRAAAADAEMRAARIDARRAGSEDALRARDLVRRFALQRGDRHALARERTFDEDRFTGDPRNTAALLVERADLDRRWRGVAGGSFRHGMGRAGRSFSLYVADGTGRGGAGSSMQVE